MSRKSPSLRSKLSIFSTLDRRFRFQNRLWSILGAFLDISTFAYLSPDLTIHLVYKCIQRGGPWSLVPGPWSLVPGPWSLVPGPWSLVPGPWSLVPGPWSLVPGPQCDSIALACPINDDSPGKVHCTFPGLSLLRIDPRRFQNGLIVQIALSSKRPGISRQLEQHR
jgi:hypothetical protein